MDDKIVHSYTIIFEVKAFLCQAKLLPGLVGIFATVVRPRLSFLLLMIIRTNEADFLNNTNHSKYLLKSTNGVQLGIYTQHKTKKQLNFLTIGIVMAFLTYVYAQEMTVFLSNIRWSYQQLLLQKKKKGCLNYMGDSWKWRNRHFY